MLCENKDHNERFKRVFFATNGCLACELEMMTSKNNRLGEKVKELEEFNKMLTKELGVLKTESESRIKELEYIMTCDPDHWDSAYVKWATEKAEARIKELERQLSSSNQIREAEKKILIKEIEKKMELVEGIQGILNQKDLMSFTIQKQLEELITGRGSYDTKLGRYRQLSQEGKG